MDGSSLGIVGGISLTLVKVYGDRLAPDGTHSGCPHVHGLTDESYYVTKGSGAIELHSPDMGFRVIPVQPGSYVQYPPNVIHRLVSDGDLEVLALIGNAGLAERGDARIWFGPSVDEDPSEYARLLGLPAQFGIEGALQRRDEAVRTYVQFKELWSTDRRKWQSEIDQFVKIHLTSLSEKRTVFASIIESGPQASVQRVLGRLRSLPNLPASSDLPPGCVSGIAPNEVLGMCGRLTQLDQLQKIAPVHI